MPVAEATGTLNSVDVWVIAEQFGIGVVVSEKVALLADQLDGCLVQGEEVMEVGLLLAHLGVADPPTKRFGVGRV